MIRSKDIEIINKAFKICEKYKEAKIYNLVSVLADGKKIISVGVNDYKKTHPNTPQIYTTHVIPTHAEVHSISKWIAKNRKITEDMTLYVVGYTKANEIISSSKPCPSCHCFIRKVGISRVVYIENSNLGMKIKELII